jgi:methionine-rich copper-binding protein CopC
VAPGWKAALLVLSLLAPEMACAHTMLRKSEPVQRAQLARAPAAVRLWFSERLEPAFSSAVVEDAKGVAVTQGKAAVSSQDPNLLELKLPPLPAGQYTVRYQVMSVDGHTVKSSYTFQVKDGAQ